MLTDFDCFRGKYRAVSCEWKGDSKHNCGEPTVYGRAYCATHLAKAYIVVSEDELEKQAEKELNKVENASVPMIEE